MSANAVKISNAGIKVVTVGTQGPSGSSGAFADLDDVNITSAQEGDTLTYDSAQAKFINQPQTNLTDGGNF